MSDYLHDPFGTPPRDITTQPRGLTREALKRMNDMVGGMTDYTTPGEVLEDHDGIPNAVGPSTTTRAYFGGVAIAQTDVDRLGLTADELATDYPNITVIDAPNQKEEN